jgi:UPF0176 protein
MSTPVRADQAVSVVAAYRFVELPDAAALRARFESELRHRGLLGTVIVATEGLNLSLAGAPDAVRAWLDTLMADARFAGLDLKCHGTDRMPFQRLRVKLKPEIIRMNRPTVRPAEARAPSVEARTLARWLEQGHCDAGRPLALLDTRNAFEVDHGAFAGALDWRLDKFSDFPKALSAHAGELRGKTVVSYCTGGIRCEKAALWMAQAGVEHVLQLEGGILRYFEDTGTAPHWQGECFVFDQRTSLAAADLLQPR